MAIVDQAQVDRWPAGRPAYDAVGIHRSVLPALDNEDGQREFQRKRIVLRRVLVELEADDPRAVVGVVKDGEMAGAPPLVDAMVAQVAQAVAAELERRRQQDDPIDGA